MTRAWPLPLLLLCLAVPARAEAPASVRPAGAAIDVADLDVAVSSRTLPRRQPRVNPRDDFDELVLELALGDTVLLPDLIALQRGDQVWAPLGPVVRALDFLITVDVPSGMASGWFIDESRRFELDVSKRTIRVGSKTRAFQPEQIIWRDELYVRLDALGDWLSMVPTFDFQAMRLSLATQESLPLARRLERERMHRQVVPRTIAANPLKALANGPKMLAVPLLDLRVEAAGGAFGRAGGSAASQAGTTQYNVGGQGDLLWMESDWGVAGSQHHPVSLASLRMARRDALAGLLGPLGARELLAGDLSTMAMPLVVQSDLGRGVAVSNFPLAAPREFDRTRLEGQLPVGWDAELFRNGELLAFTSATNGHYLFADVPLLFGRNELRVVMHGPHGERREVVQQTLVGANLVRPGEFSYAASVTQDRETVLPLQNLATSPTAGQLRVMGRVEQGVTRQFSLTAGAASVASATGPRTTHGSAGARAVVGNVYAEGDLVAQVDGGAAGHASIQTGLGSTTLVVEHARFGRDFTSEVAANAPGLDSRSRLRIDSPIEIGGLGQVGLGLDNEVDTFASGHSVERVTARTGLTMDSLYLATSAMAGAQDYAGWQVLGVTSGRYRTALATPRVDLAWNRRGGGIVLDQAKIGADVRLGSWTSAEVEVQHSLTDGTTLARVGLRQQRDAFAWGAQVAGGSDAGISAGLTFEMHLGTQPRTGKWTASSMSLGGTGAVLAHVFVDRDGDGRFGAGDEPIAGARFRIENQDTSKAITDADGYANLTRLQAYVPVEIRLDRGSLPDVYALPRPEFQSVLPRIGGTVDVDFPVVLAGAIEGSLRHVASQGGGAVADMSVELRSGEEVVARQKSAYDGFFVFEDVMPGTYSVRVAADQATGDWHLPPPQRVVIGADGPVVSGIDFGLTEPSVAWAGVPTAGVAPREAPAPVPSTPAVTTVPEAVPSAGAAVQPIRVEAVPQTMPTPKPKVAAAVRPRKVQRHPVVVATVPRDDAVRWLKQLQPQRWVHKVRVEQAVLAHWIHQTVHRLTDFKRAVLRAGRIAVPRAHPAVAPHRRTRR
ncbi:MAG: hypothetical protein ACOYOB_11200 [Myxococcota bacterium]